MKIIYCFNVILLLIFSFTGCNTSYSNQETDSFPKENTTEAWSSNTSIQLQNRINGLTLGERYSDDVLLNSFTKGSNGNYKIEKHNNSNSNEFWIISTEEYNRTLEVGKNIFYFGGYEWNIIIFDIDKENTLYQIEFRSINTRTTINERFKELSSVLINKYGEPCLKKTNYLMWDDGKNQIQLQKHGSISGDISLVYYDVRKAVEVVNKDISEL